MQGMSGNSWPPQNYAREDAVVTKSGLEPEALQKINSFQMFQGVESKPRAYHGWVGVTQCAAGGTAGWVGAGREADGSVRQGYTRPLDFPNVGNNCLEHNRPRIRNLTMC